MARKTKLTSKRPAPAKKRAVPTKTAKRAVPTKTAKRAVPTKTTKRAAPVKRRASSVAVKKKRTATPAQRRTAAKAREVAKTLKTARPTRRPASSDVAKKRAATAGTKERAGLVSKFARAASQVYGKDSRTATRLKELSAAARRWELEARRAKTLSAKQRARAEASRVLQSARLTFTAATREGTAVVKKDRGWQEVQRFDASRAEVDTFTSYEHARQSAGSVLSLLESRPGVVGILSWRRTSQVERSDLSGITPNGELRGDLKERADAVAVELGLTGRQREEFDAMLFDAELYGVEVELEVENYVEA